jgi:hypothetical protein
MNKLWAALLPVVVVLGVAAVGASGCSGPGAQGGCPDVAPCGGDPSGFWQIESACEYIPPQPSQPLSYRQYTMNPIDPTLTAVAPSPTTSGDWCSGLFFPGLVSHADLWHDTALWNSGTMSFDSSSQTYTTSMVFMTPGSTDFPVACLQSGGFGGTCSELQSQLNAYYVCGFFPNPSPYLGIACAADGAQGCNCTYTYQVEVVDQGTWTASNGILTQKSDPFTYFYNGVSVLEDAPVSPIAATYCENGNSLTLTGDHGASLSNIFGLRTLTAQRATAPPDAGTPAPPAKPSFCP